MSCAKRFSVTQLTDFGKPTVSCSMKALKLNDVTSDHHAV